MAKNKPTPPKADAPKAGDPSASGADPTDSPPPKADPDCYLCVDPVRHDGKDYTGEIKLTPEQAAPLLAVGAIKKPE